MKLKEQGMSLIVKTVTRLITGFILIFGLYLVIYGHITPGGGFSGGVVISLALILTLLAFGKKFVDTHALIGDDGMKAVDVFGAFAFLLIALLGYFAGSFFSNAIIGHGKPFHLVSGGIIPFCNLAIGLKVGACLFGVLVALAVFHSKRRHDPSEPKEEE